MTNSQSTKIVNDVLIEAMQLLAEARANKDLPESAEKVLNGALEKLGQAFALTRTVPTTNSTVSQRLDEVFITNETYYTSATGISDLDLLCLNDGPMPEVDCAPGQLEHLFLSAILSVKEFAGGNRPITISIDQAQIAALDESSSTPMQPGHYAVVTFQTRTTTTGRKSPVEQIKEVFRNAEEAESMAPGLGNIQRIVESLDGACFFDATMKRKPALLVFLPLSRALANESLKVPSTKPGSHDEVVLLVDDDPMVRSYTKRALEFAGFSVLEAGDSRAAINMLKKQQGKIDILITDLVLPDMHGGKLAHAVQKEFGAVPVIFVSGYDDQAIKHHNLIEDGATLLHKPFTRRTLLTTVEAALEIEAS